MRVLFASLSGHGHTFPLLPLASAAVRAGHQVAYATAEEFHPTLRGLGAEPVRAGMTMPDAFGVATTELFGEQRDPRSLAEEQRNRLIGHSFGHVLARGWVADLEPVLAEWRPDLVVYEAGCPGAGLAAEAAGIAAVAHGFGRHTEDDGAISAIRKAIGEFAEGMGLPAAPGELTLLDHRFLDIFPPSLQDRRFVAEANRMELRPVPFAQPGELPAALDLTGRTRPLVYLTMGTGAGAEAAALREAILGLGTLDVDVLVAAGPAVPAAELGELPGNVLLESWVPQAEVLRHADLVVHHAGSGTTLGAFGAGVPQLALPRGADQFVNARSVLDSGAGDRLLPAEADAAAVAERAARVLGGEEFRAASRRVAAEVAAMPAPEDVARRLPEIAS